MAKCKVCKQATEGKEKLCKRCLTFILNKTREKSEQRLETFAATNRTIKWRCAAALFLILLIYFRIEFGQYELPLLLSLISSSLLLGGWGSRYKQRDIELVTTEARSTKAKSASPSLADEGRIGIRWTMVNYLFLLLALLLSAALFAGWSIGRYSPPLLNPGEWMVIKNNETVRSLRTVF